MLHVYLYSFAIFIISSLKIYSTYRRGEGEPINFRAELLRVEWSNSGRVQRVTRSKTKKTYIFSSNNQTHRRSFKILAIQLDTVTTSCSFNKRIKPTMFICTVSCRRFIKHVTRLNFS